MFANPVTVTLNSCGASRAVNLDWMNGGNFGVLVLGASTGTTATIQLTLDDIQQTASSLVTWISDPNFTAATSATSTVYTYTAPITAIRINSSSATGLSPLTLKVTQGSFV